MIKRFFEILVDLEAMAANRKLFEGLNIEKHTEIMDTHGGKYPVILLDFKSVSNIGTFNVAFSAVRTIVHEAYGNHSYLQYSDKITVSSNRKRIEHWCDPTEYETRATEDGHIFDALKNLAKYLRIHFNAMSVLLLVDEYDSICSNAVFNVKDYFDEKTKNRIKADDEIQRIIQFCIRSIACLAKGNNNIGRVILTGISYLMTRGLSTLNNIEHYKFQETHPYQPYYGLSTEEVKKLLHKFSLDLYRNMSS